MNRANQSFDVLIVGGGAVGCAIARELARYRLSIALVEKEADVAAGTSGRNSAVVHAGFNNRPGSLMAKLCVAGNQGFPALCQELDVPFRKTGKILVAFDETDLATLWIGRSSRPSSPRWGASAGSSPRRRGSATPSCTPWPWRRMPWPTGWPSS